MEKESLKNEIISFENNYQLNSFEIIKTNSNLYREWKEKLALYLFANENPFEINQTKPLNIVYFTLDPTEDERDLTEKLKAFSNMNNNSIAIVLGSNYLYDGLIKKINDISKYVYLITKNRKDIQLKNIYEHLIVCVTDNVFNTFNNIEKHNQIIYL